MHPLICAGQSATLLLNIFSSDDGMSYMQPRHVLKNQGEMRE